MRALDLMVQDDLTDNPVPEPAEHEYDGFSADQIVEYECNSTDDQRYKRALVLRLLQRIAINSMPRALEALDIINYLETYAEPIIPVDLSIDGHFTVKDGIAEIKKTALAYVTVKTKRKTMINRQLKRKDR